VTLLTGHPPEDGRPAWEGIEPGRAGDIERAIRRGLAIDPGRRPATASQLVERLSSFLARLPSGMVTFLLTDIEASTRLWDLHPDEMTTALARHDGAVADAVEAHGGRLIKSKGEGDSTVSVFTRASDAIAAAVTLQSKLGTMRHDGAIEIRIRAAVHTGEADLRDGDYYGPALNRAARLRSLASGGQVVLSRATADLVADALPPGAALVHLGVRDLRGLSRPEEVVGLAHPDLSAPGLAPPAPVGPAHRGHRPLGNLPAQRSSFVGRGAELDHVRALVQRHRVVTLTGVGGAGKTRLALEASAGLMERFPQGVFFIDLALVSDASLVPEAFASALGLHVVEPNADNLADVLQSRRLLLVPDNCEHVLDACAQLVDVLVSRCSDLSVLATSREALGIEGERSFRVPSLDVATDAVALFIDRANAVRASMMSDLSDPAAIQEICVHLDGLPLAIELAAARTAHLAPREILDRLTDRFRLLTGGRRRIQRQQTLSAAIDWSHDLLDDDEKTTLRRLAVFRGSFSLRAAEDICHPRALDVLGSLVAKSLVNLAEGVGTVRYRLLETVRAYAEERLLDSGDAAAVRAKHRDWYLAWIESLPVDELVGILGAGARLEGDGDNLQTAINWSRQEERPDLVVRIASRMIGYWWSFVRVGKMAACWHDLQEAIPDLDPELRAGALLIGSQLDMVTAQVALDDVEHFINADRVSDVERRSAEVISLASRDSWQAAYAWTLQALYWPFVDRERGRAAIQEGLRCASAARLPEIWAETASFSVNEFARHGDPSRDAVRFLEEAYAAVPRGSRSVLAFASAFAVVDQMGRAAEARSLVDPVTPFTRYTAAYLDTLVAIDRGERAAAIEHLKGLCAIVRDHAIPRADDDCVTAFAALAAMDHDYERAARLLASARGNRVVVGRIVVSAAAYRRVRDHVRGHLDRATIARLREEGAAISVSEAIDAELARLPAASQPR
jgi:predicted ATPase/class 3 adenylate cyclase